MRRTDLDQVANALDGPMRQFVREARVRVALLVNRSGQVMVQHGFTHRYEVIEIASLVAAANAAAGALAEMTGAGRWTHLHHAGRVRELVLAPVSTPSEPLILAAVFEEDSSLGLVQLYIDQLAADVAALPEMRTPTPTSDPVAFERDLEAGLDRLFGPDTAVEG
ncbi:MAG: roadblock/LC7 domain-containing protein [Gemmatimonadota bacterium]